MTQAFILSVQGTRVLSVFPEGRREAGPTPAEVEAVNRKLAAGEYKISWRSDYDAGRVDLRITL